MSTKKFTTRHGIDANYQDIVSANNVSTNTLTALVSTGTPPLSITSTTKVDNLNVDLLDSYHAAISNTANTVVVRDANTFISLNGIYMNSSEGLKRIAWNDTYSTYDMQLLDGVTLQVGQESHIYGRATETIQNGQVVMFAGAQGDGLLLRVANTQISGFEPRWIVGVATQTIPQNNWGYVTWFGKVNDVDTYNYSLGDVLYLNNSVAGGLSNTRPTAPDYAVSLAAVVRKSNSPTSNNGILMVRPDFGASLSELHDVNINGISNNNVLIYSSANNRWENKIQAEITSGDSDKLDGQHGSYYTGYTDTANTNNLIYTNNAISSNVNLLAGVDLTQNTSISSVFTHANSAFNTANTKVTLNGSLGTPSSGDLSNCTNLPISTGVSGLASNVATFLSNPTSANFANTLTDEIGNSKVVFASGNTGIGNVVYSNNCLLSGVSFSTLSATLDFTSGYQGAFVCSSTVDQFTIDTSGDGTCGITLPIPTPGKRVTVTLRDPSGIDLLDIYPSSGYSINPNPVNDPYSIRPGTSVQLIYSDVLGTGSFQWIVQFDVGPALLDAQSAYNLAGTKFDSSGGTISGDVVVTGNVTVQGVTTTLDVDTLVVKDKNVVLANVASPTDVTADGAGLTVIGTTNKTWNWVDATDSWTSSENINLVSGKTYKINGVDVLTSTTISNIQGVDNTQNTSISNLTTWLNSNNTLQSGINTNQNTSISIIQGVDNTQNTSISNLTTWLNSNNTLQSDINASQNTNITNLTTWLNSNNTLQTGINASQNASITVIQGVDNTQNNRLTVIEGVDSTQNTNINNLTSWLNSNNTLQANINSTQNTNITAVNTYAGSAYTHANAAYNTANTKFNSSGGIITGSVDIEGSLIVEGNFTVSGNVTTVSANNIVLKDNMIYLNENGNTANPDLGIAGAYNDGTYRHAGFFRDASDGYWKVYDQYLPEPDISPYIDTSNSSFRIANFQANNIIGNTFSGTSNNSTYFNGNLSSYYTNASNLSSGTLPNARLSSIPNSALANSSVTVNGTAISLGSSGTVTASAGTLTGTTLASGVTGSSLTSVGTITSGTWSGSFGAVSGANLTSLTAGNLSGTIPSAVLGNSTLFVGTTAVTLNRSSGNLALTGISSITLPGSTSGTVQIIPTAAAGTGTILTIAATTGTIVTTGDTGTVTSTMMADGTIVNGDINASAAIAVSKLAASTISGVTLGNNLNALTISSPLSGTSYNGSGAVSIGLSSGYGDTQNPFASKTANHFLAAPNGTAGVPTFRAIVAADIPTLNQNTTGSAATLTTTRTLWGQNFNGSGNVTGNLTSVGDITGTSTLGLYSTTTSALNIDSGTTGAINIGTNANAKTITLGNVTGATSFVVNSGTSGVTFNQVAAGIFKVQASAAPTTDMVQITNAGQAIATAGVNSLEVTFVGGAAAVEAGAIRTGFTPGTTTGGTWNGFRIVPTAAANTGVIMNGMKFDNITAGTGTDNMIYAGTGWDNIINYNGTAVINGTGNLIAGQLSGTIPSAVLGNSTHYIGTTAIALNRASAAQSLSGVSIDGNAATATTLQTARTLTIGSTGKTFDGSANVSWTLAEIGAYAATNPSGYTTNTGTVTSVGGTGTVSGLSLSGTVTTTGNLTLSGTLSVAASNFSSQTANQFLAAPNGTAGVPTFRAIVAADIPTLNQNTTGSSGSCTGNAATVTNGFYTSGGTLTGQLISTDTWDTTTGGGNIYLNSATGNRIDFNGNGVAAPAFTTRSAGTKLVLYPNVGASSVDFALGIESNNMWFSTVDNTNGGFKWYHGTTNTMSLLSTGILSVVTGFRINNAATSGQYLRGNGTNFVSSAIQAADVPTLNQNTTGSSGSCTGNAATATNVAWSGITSKPTTVSGYGITNALVRGGAIGSIDFNAQRTLASGIYSVDAAPTNGPAGGSAYSNFIQMYERGDTAAQLVIEYSTGRMYTRGIQTAVPTYSAWRTQIDDGNYTSYAMPAGASATNSVDVRAPVFYDSNNTGYYIDPNSTSSIVKLITGSRIVLPATNDGRTNGLWHWGDGDTNWVQYMAQPTVGTNPAGTTMTAGYWDNGHSIRVRAGSWSIENHADNTVRAHINGTGAYFAGQIRSPIFYDSDDTGYYINAAGTSQCSRINCNDMFYGNGNWSYFTGIYDTNDTAYYVDPNSTSRVNLLKTTNWLYLDNNYGHSIVGVYTHTIFQGVFAMGDAYKLTAAGGINNLYGMCWSYPSAGGIAANLDSHGMIVAINGGFGSCMSYSIKASGNVTAYSDERLKKNWGPMPENFVSRLAKVKVGTYDRMDGERLRQVGVSAQSLRPLLPEAVIEANDDIKTLSVSYGNAAMASAVELAKEIIQLKDQINLLTERLNKMGC
jgi:hypothetical protein